MTQDGPGRGPHDAPPPPTSTQWSGPEADDDPGLMPPFVPGRSRADRDEEPVLGTDDAMLDTDDAVADAPETVREGAETDLASTPDDDQPFPFDLPVAEDPLPFHGRPPGEAGDEPPGIELERQEQAEASDEASGPVEVPGTDHAPWTGTAEVAESHGQTPAPEPGETADAVGPAADVADRLEALADRLRSEGQRGAESEMASLDRFTALIAGVVTGYLAGLRE
jgi:hypothetical protein